MAFGSRSRLLIGILSACIVLAATLAIAAKLLVSRFDTMAEGIETAEQLDCLREMGCRPLDFALSQISNNPAPWSPHCSFGRLRNSWSRSTLRP